MEIPVWRGGSILMDGLSKDESYLDFEPDSMIDEDGNLVFLVGLGSPALIPIFEICVYAEHEHQLEPLFKKAIEDVRKKFSGCRMWEDENPVKMAPKDDGSVNRHTLDWQMFGQFRAIGSVK